MWYSILELVIVLSWRKFSRKSTILSIWDQNGVELVSTQLNGNRSIFIDTLFREYPADDRFRILSRNILYCFLIVSRSDYSRILGKKNGKEISRSTIKSIVLAVIKFNSLEDMWITETIDLDLLRPFYPRIRGWEQILIGELLCLFSMQSIVPSLPFLRSTHS